MCVVGLPALIFLVVSEEQFRKIAAGSELLTPEEFV